jgi:hypothetical protein
VKTYLFRARENFKKVWREESYEKRWWKTKRIVWNGRET